MQKLHDGIPLTQEYLALLEDENFKTMEKYSNEFLSKNQNSLQDYIKRRGKDPFHHWSRQWEYPYVFDVVKEVSEKGTDVTILDAGSGVTFFPYYINYMFNKTKVHCCDYDGSLPNVYNHLNSNTNIDVEFSTADLKNLPYKKNAFDAIYCISVLEHTNDYEKIIEEFYRILRPNGALIITFDISLDGKRKINVDQANILLTALAKRFVKNNNFYTNIHSQVTLPNVFTTHIANDIDNRLLPWGKKSFFKRMVNYLKAGSTAILPPLLTVYCLRLTKN